MSVVADPTHVVGRRVVAALVDGAIVLGPGIALVTSQLEYIEHPSQGSAEAFCDDFLDTFTDGVCVELDDTTYYDQEPGTGPILLMAGLTLGMFVLLQGLTGWTVGKLLTGIRTVREDGRRVGIGRAAVRWVFWIVDGLPFLGLVGFITALTTTGHRRVGDMVAKSFVVRAAAAGRPILVPGVTGPPAAPPGPTPSAGGPQWDEGRGTYIQWDPEAGTWMQWDEPGRRWDPIPGQPSGAPPPPPPPPVAPPPPPPPGGPGADPPAPPA